jgi:mannose-1-phosphate guanylyltransferase
MNNRYVIIMAGGVGSRFWQLSRSKKPKQFLDILGTGETLLQQTFRRFKSVCPKENILVVTNGDHKDLVIKQLGIKPDRVLSEPLRKNTAPCIAYGTFIIRNENQDAVISVTPADHIITNEDEFRKTINSGFDFAQENDVLITLGIKPDKPETGYGYIQSRKNDSTKGFNNLLKVKRSLKSQIWKRQNHSLKAVIFIGTQAFLSGAQNQLLRHWKLFCPIYVMPSAKEDLFPGLLMILTLLTEHIVQFEAFQLIMEYLKKLIMFLFWVPIWAGPI